MSEYPIQYLNVNMVKGVDNLANKPTQATYNQIFSAPIIEDASKYYLAISRMAVSTSLIPLLVCPIVLGQPNPLLTPYQMYAYYDGNLVFNQNILFITQNLNAPSPNPPLSNQDNSNGYYNVNTIEYFLISVNITLRQLSVALYNAGASIPDPNEPTRLYYNSPFVRYNDNTNLFELVVPKEYNQYGLVPNRIQIYFNEPLNSLLGLKNGPIGRLDNIDQQIYSLMMGGEPFGGTFEYIYDDNGDQIQRLVMSGDHRAIDKWSPMAKIVITSSSIPVASEFSQPSTLYGTSVNINNKFTLPLGQKILTDFEPDFYNNPITNRNWIQYNTTGINNYRILNLLSSYKEGIRQFDLQIWWMDFNNNLYPILLGAGDSVNIKFVFVPKKMIINQ